MAPADLVLPVLPGAFGDELRRQVAELAAAAVARHRVVPVPVEGLRDALGRTPVGLSTMGRGLTEDPAAFLAGAAAGRYTASLLP